MRHPFQPRRLADILLERGYTKDAHVSTFSAENEHRLGKQLVADNVITAEQLTEALADQFSLPYVDLSRFTIGPDLYEYLSAAQAYQWGAVPYRVNGESIDIAIADPFDLTLPDKLERAT